MSRKTDILESLIPWILLVLLVTGILGISIGMVLINKVLNAL